MNKNIEKQKNDLSKSVITITSELSKFVMNEDLNKEYTQTIEIRDNMTIVFDTYNFMDEQMRHEYLILKDRDIDTMINDIKNILDVFEAYPIAKDGDNWKIEINENGRTYYYSGDITNSKEENKKISMYIRNLVKLDDLILLDGNK